MSTTTTVMPDITCPPWCTGGPEHQAQFAETTYVYHRCVVSRDEAKVQVVIDQFAIDEDKAVTEPAAVGVIDGDEVMTTDEAIRLAADLLRAVAIIQEAADGEDPT